MSELDLIIYMCLGIFVLQVLTLLYIDSMDSLITRLEYQIKKIKKEVNKKCWKKN